MRTAPVKTYSGRDTDTATEVVGELAARHADAAELCRHGRHKQAIPRLAAVLSDCRGVLGPDHPDTLRVSGNLAVACVAGGRRRDGVTMLVRRGCRPRARAG